MKLIFHTVITLVFLIASPVMAETQPGSDLTNEADFRSETSLDSLVEWEMLRLDNLSKGADVEIKLLPGSKLSEKVHRALEAEESKKSDGKEKPKSNGKLKLSELRKYLALKQQLTPNELKELLAILRAQNEMEKTGGTIESTMSNALKQELEGIAANSRGGVGRVLTENPEIRKALQEAYQKKFDGKKLFYENGPEAMKNTASASELAKLFNEVPPLKPQELQSLLGDVRAQAPEVRGKNFLADFSRDLQDDGRFLASGPDHPYQTDPNRSAFWANGPRPNSEDAGKQQVVVRNSPSPAVNFRQPPSAAGPQSGPSGHGSGGSSRPSAGRAASSGGFGETGGGSVSSGGGGRSFSVPDDFFSNKGQLTASNAGALLGEMQRQNSSSVQAFSLKMKTEHQTSPNTLEEGFCQITVAKKEQRGDRCIYKAPTAAHCLDKFNPSYRMTVENIPNITDVGIDFAPGGQDAAILTLMTLGPCVGDDLVPVIPVASEGIGEGGSILVAGRKVIAGRASPSEVPRELDPTGGSLVQLDIRQRVNGGLGIYQGDSGGGVVRVDPQTGRKELVGVISSKLVDPQYRDGIGFMAAKSALDWFREMIPSSGSNEQRVAQTLPSQDRTTPQTHAN